MILSFTATVEKFDKDAYSRAVKAEVRKTFMKAGQKFLLAAVPRIPIWTGMLRGAFRNLEDLVGKVTSDAQSPTGVRIRTTQSTSTSHKAGRGGGGRNIVGRLAYYYDNGTRIQRTPQAGRQFATATDKILDVAGATLATGKTSFYFRFEVNINYFDLLDVKRGWNAWKAASDALEAYIKGNLTLPDPLKYTTRKIIKSS